MPSGARNARWNGGRYNHGDGYVMIALGDRGYVMEHVDIVERAIGRRLRSAEEVHHANGVKNDNRPSNLVACQDRAYHMLLHRRRRALVACGHADWRSCVFCLAWDDPLSMVGWGKYSYAHRSCAAIDARVRARAKNGDPTVNKRNASLAMWASRSPEERSAQAKRAWATRKGLR